MNVVNAIFAYGSSGSNNSAQSFNPWVDGDQAHANDLSATMGEVDQEMGGDNLQAMGEQAMGDEATGNEAMRDEDMQDATATSGSKDSGSGVEGGKVGSLRLLQIQS